MTNEKTPCKKLTRKEVLSMLKQHENTYRRFQSFEKKYQEELLAFLMGTDFLHITYDPFFKEIFDPYRHRERVERLISALLGKTVVIKEVLQHEGKRLSGSSSLVIMDIVAQLSDGSYLDVEIQKIGYAFPGERTCCYSADLILRQYDRLRAQYKEAFSYRKMMPVQVIILMEESTDIFQKAFPQYIHRKQTSYSSGVNVTELSQILYISLDTFSKVVQNKAETPLHAWLTLLSTTDISVILELTEKYPDFLSIYQEIMAFRTNPEELITMFSEALSIMDRNTELYMIEEMRQKAEQMQRETEQKQQKIEQMNQETERLQQETEKLQQETEKLQQIAEQRQQKLDQMNQETEKLQQETEKLHQELTQKDEEIRKLREQLAAK